MSTEGSPIPNGTGPASTPEPTPGELTHWQMPGSPTHRELAVADGSVQKYRKRPWSSWGIAVVSGLMPLLGIVGAQEAHDHGGASHGGVEAMTKRHHFEAVFAKGGVRLYVHGADHKSVDVSHLSASATFYHPSSSKPWFTRKLRPAATASGLPPASLDLTMNLSRVPTKGAKVSLEVSGLPDPGEPTVSFTVPFTLADDGSITVGKATKADEEAITAHKVCPVSGEELGGEMGPPVKVTRGGKTIFLCCKNCLKQVQADPDKYFDASTTPRAEAHHHNH